LPWSVWYKYEQTGMFTEEKWGEIEKLIERQRDGSMTMDE